MSEHIKTRVDANGVATVLIDRNERKNAMTWAMLRAFTDAFAELGDDPSVRVIVLTGGDQGSFCAGTDLSDLESTPEAERGTRGGAAGGGDRGPERYWQVLQCPKPVIAAIDGAAVGMGAEFTSQADVRIASSRARFAWNFVHRGLVPDTGAGTWLLPRLIGVQRALRYLYTGEFLSAEHAYEIGYVVELVRPERLLETAYAEAERWLAGSPFAMSRVKALVYDGLERSAAEHVEENRRRMQECFASNDHKEGVAAFLEKRTPKFTGT